ncbi:MAG TPA: prepilin-type N-terminal cleavage/methylation domain-containing protein [Candidatus Omnitrophica bacterium]|nr:prepilin-type N-terminal cleavage/methylation domain-containing protein [Candidatus Omnitrophota bacterium]
MRGFTLLELIMVVIIIGVLAGIAIPQYLNSVERAKAGKAISNMTLIRRAQHLYRADNSEYHDISMGGWDAASPAGLGGYVELGGVDADVDWDYDTTANDESAFEITATRMNGAYTGEDLIMDENGMTAFGTWTLPY